MKPKFFLAAFFLTIASFALATDSKPTTKPASDKKEVAKESGDESCCEPASPDSVKKEEAKPAPATAPKK